MKRYITANDTVTSGFSFDFVWEDDYDMQDIQDAVFRVFEDQFNMEVLGVDFYSVDYEDVKEYSGKNITQCGVDFRWTGDDYNQEDIFNAIDEEMTALGYEVIGYDFYTL